MILTGDLHLTDRARDEYRWKVFDQLIDAAKQNESIVILGDITDKKDKHTAKLVNRVSDEVLRLADHTDVWILKGNHDYLDEDVPFFRFLNEMPGVHYVVKPGLHAVDWCRIQFLPHTFNPKKAWDVLPDIGKADYVFAHQTFAGAVSSTGQSLSGVGTTFLADRHSYDGRVYSGDIHVPQDIGPVTYVGTPYPVAFGDEYDCRLIRLNRKGQQVDLPLDNIRKHTIELLAVEDFIAGDYNEGDQLKIKLKIRRSEFGEAQQMMKEIRTMAESYGLKIFGFKLEERKLRKRKRFKSAPDVTETPADTLKRFCKMEGIDKALVEHGQQLLNESAQ